MPDNTTPSFKKFIPITLHLLNKEGWISRFTLQDHRTKTDYKFTCPHCTTAITINTNGAASISFLTHEIDPEAMVPFVGTAFFSKIISCTSCHTKYFIGIDYLEPNNGRDVLVLHNIVELK